MSAPSSTKLRLLRARPLCIVCAQPAAAEGIARSLGVLEDRLTGREVADIHDAHIFYLGSLRAGDRKLEYYITSSLRQSIQSFATHVSVLFQILRPKYAIHAGVCAGYSGTNIKLRDVIFGESATNYEEGKWIRGDNDQLTFQPDFEILRAYTGDMQSFAESEGRANYHYGDFVSGSAVRTDARGIIERIRSTADRNTIALDMEASAFLKICQHVNVTSLGVIKGVSNFGDPEKGRDPSTYGQTLVDTANAINKWLLHNIPSINGQLDEESEPGAQLSKGYYENFVRVVLDANCHEVPAINLHKNETILAHQIQGLKIVMPDDFDVKAIVEAGQIVMLTKKRDVQEVSIGNRSLQRTLHYKAGYLLDFCLNLNSLADLPDSFYQAQLFQNALRKRPYFSPTTGQATICSWLEFNSWLDEVDGDLFQNGPVLSQRAF